MTDPTIKGESFKEIIVMEQTRFNTVDDLARFANHCCWWKNNRSILGKWSCLHLLSITNINRNYSESARSKKKRFIGHS